MLAVELALAGHEVCVIARGAHLRAIQERGSQIRIDGREKVAAGRRERGSADFGPQDFVICTLKAHQAYEKRGRFAPLLGSETAVLTAMNGVPWWYFYKGRGADSRVIAWHRWISTDGSGSRIDRNA